jgi:hypothetical protein
LEAFDDWQRGSMQKVIEVSENLSNVTVEIEVRRHNVRDEDNLSANAPPFAISNMPGATESYEAYFGQPIMHLLPKILGDDELLVKSFHMASNMVVSEGTVSTCIIILVSILNYKNSQP